MTLPSLRPNHGVLPTSEPRPAGHAQPRIRQVPLVGGQNVVPMPGPAIRPESQRMMIVNRHAIPTRRIASSTDVTREIGFDVRDCGRGGVVITRSAVHRPG